MINAQVSFQDYPYYSAENMPDVKEVIRQMAAIRKDDVTQIANLPNIFLHARKVGKIPISSSDVDPNYDKVGDISWDLSFLYVLVDDGAAGVWRRASLGSW